MNRPGGRSRLSRLVSLVSAVCAGGVFLCAPALASTPGKGSAMSSQTSTEPVTDTPMGSQIRKHEGGDEHAVPEVDPLATVPGMDVSSHQGNVDWQSWWNQGMKFAYVKATEGTGYTNPYFAQQYNGSYDVGMIRGAYHFALPDRSSGAAQANYFVDNGGGWSKDGKTLPGALDMEYNPYGDTCYGKSKSQMTAWIKDFSDTYHSRTGRWPVIYTSTSWWNQCVDGDFSSTNPLWVARYADSVGQLPHNWSVWTIWQYTSSPLDKNTFNGAYDRLQALANG
ncbi:lysozyme [Saccharopolyspora hordei]